MMNWSLVVHSVKEGQSSCSYRSLESQNVNRSRSHDGVRYDLVSSVCQESSGLNPSSSRSCSVLDRRRLLVIDLCIVCSIHVWMCFICWCR